MIPLTLLLLAAPQTARAGAPEVQPPSVRPPFSFLRQAEDWSGFRASSSGGDTFDDIKHVELTEDGDLWVSFGGRLESRVETWREFAFGANGAPSVDDTFIVSRAIVHADAHLGESLRAFAEVKSAQATDRDLPGGRRPLDMDTLELQQAFVDVHLDLLGGDLRLRPGRQSLLFGNQRLVSPLPWGNTLRAWDGITAAWCRGDWTVNGLATAFVPVDKTGRNRRDRDTTLYGLYATRRPVEGGRGLDLYALGNERAGVTVNGTAGDERRTTVGARSWGPLGGPFDLEVEGAWQFGEVGEADVEAWFIAAEAGYRVPDLAGAPRFWVGLDVASGDKRAGGDVQTFHQLFPLGHAFLGYADFVGRQNSVAVSAGATWTLRPRTTLSVDLHHFRVLETGDALYAAGGQPLRSGFSSDEVASELDLLLRSRLDAHLSAYAGYSHVFAGDALEETGSSEDVDFLYVGAAYTF